MRTLKKFKVRTSFSLGSPAQDIVRTKFSIIWHIEGVIDDFGQLRFTLNLTKQAQNYPFLKDANFRLTPLFYVNSPKPQVRKKKVLSPGIMACTALVVS